MKKSATTTGLFLNRATTLTLILAFALMAGCASSQKRFEQGYKDELKGDYEKAADRYIQALRKDPSNAEARARLEDVATQAMNDAIGEARALRRSGRMGDAADAMIALDRRMSGAESVGFDPPWPANYDQEQRATMDDAIAELMDLGHARRADRNWNGAVSAFEKTDRYDPSVDQVEAARTAHYETLIAWTDHDYRDGRFLDALEHADAAIAFYGGPGAARRAAELREEIIIEATIFTAPIPVAMGERADLPTEFRDILNDDLEIEFWSSPPPLLAFADGPVVRRALRDRRVSRGMPSAREASRLGRDLDSDLVVVAEIREFSTSEQIVKSKSRDGESRAGADTTYTVNTMEYEIDAEIYYEIIDTGRRRVVKKGEIRESVSGKFDQVHGDASDLKLSRRDREKFSNRRAMEERQDLDEELARELARRYAERLFDELLTQVQ